MAVVGNFGLHINKGKHKTKQPNGELISKYKNNPSLIQEMELHQVTSRSKHIMVYPTHSFFIFFIFIFF